MYAPQVTTIALLTVACTAAIAATATVAVSVPVGAKQHLPELKLVIKNNWATLSTPSIIGGQIEQESCISLTHKRCWNSNVELKTSREYGFGLGQITIAYDKNGKVRFNNFEEAKKQFPKALSAWKWEDRFNASYQMTTMVLMDKNLYNRSMSLTPNDKDRLAFMLSAYNGGFGGVLQDRKLCQATKGCDPSLWFGNVAAYSFKSKTKVKGYGESAYDINRGYVDQVMNKRRFKYIPYLEQ